MMKDDAMLHASPGRAVGAAAPPLSERCLQLRIMDRRRRARRRAQRELVRDVATAVLPLLLLLVGVAIAVLVTRRVDWPQDSAALIPLLSITGTLTAALIAGSIAVNSFVRTPARIKRLELAVGYTERQIDELWGPLHGALKVSQAYYDELLRASEPLLDDNGDPAKTVHSSHLSRDPFAYLFQETWSQWEAFSKAHLLPQSKVVRELLTSNYDLIGYDPFPDIDAFLSHEAEYRVKFEVLCASTTREQRKGPSDAERPELHCPYPYAFTYHVEYKIQFLTTLQRKFRLQLEGGRRRKVFKLAVQAAEYRARAENPPPEALPTPN